MPISEWHFSILGWWYSVSRLISSFGSTIRALLGRLSLKSQRIFYWTFSRLEWRCTSTLEPHLSTNFRKDWKKSSVGPELEVATHTWQVLRSPRIQQIDWHRSTYRTLLAFSWAMKMIMGPEIHLRWCISRRRPPQRAERIISSRDNICTHRRPFSSIPLFSTVTHLMTKVHNSLIRVNECITFCTTTTRTICASENPRFGPASRPI